MPWQAVARWFRGASSVQTPGTAIKGSGFCWSKQEFATSITNSERAVDRFAATLYPKILSNLESNKSFACSGYRKQIEQLLVPLPISKDSQPFTS